MIQYRAGAVWWRRIDFGKGKGSEKKYFVLLSDEMSNGEFVLAMTTSNGDRYHDAASPGLAAVAMVPERTSGISNRYHACGGQRRTLDQAWVKLSTTE